MIVFELECVCGCIFEGWFQDREDFEKQQDASFLSCPDCCGRNIRKVLSPIRFQTKVPSETALFDSTGTKETVSMKEVEKAMKTLQDFVEKNFEDVGADFAKESLKVHYGVSEPRNIRGVTTEKEEEELQKEGINFLKIPMIPNNKDIN
jgi:hypothetical protein